MMNERKIAQIARLIMNNQDRMTKEQDIKNFFETDEEYTTNLKILVERFRNLGLNLIRTDFQNTKYFVLSSSNKDKQISPAMYGALAILIAIYNEIGDDISLHDVKRVLFDVWDEVELLIDAQYLKIDTSQEEERIILTPLAKAATQNIMKNLNVKTILDLL